jgi:hypothetical protein
MLISQSQCDRCSYFDEHINLKSGIMGGSYSLSIQFISVFCIHLFLNIPL